MSRPLKSGLDYFPHDTDASEDEKIEALSSLYGNDGYAFYFRILERIYKKENCRLDLSTDIAMRLTAKRCYLRIDRFQRILETSLEVGLFSKEVFNNSKELFSAAITSRAEKVFRHRSLNRPSYVQKEGITSAVTPQETQQKPKDIAAVTTQQCRKEKKSKVNKEIYKEKTTFGKDNVVKLTAEQYQELIKQFGEVETQERIEALAEGILSKGYKYKSHYHTILSWYRKERRDHPERFQKTTAPRYEKL